jgi:hypothetical protein
MSTHQLKLPKAVIKSSTMMADTAMQDYCIATAQKAIAEKGSDQVI